MHYGSSCSAQGPMCRTWQHRHAHADTKEPKLQAARRMVAEWPEYDAQVATFTEQARAMISLEHAQSAGSQSQTELRSAVGSERETLSEQREEL